MAKLSPVNLSSSFNSFRVKFNRMIDSVGDISSLNTDNNTTVVASINTLDSNQGSRSSLTTNVKTSLVSAINSLDSNIGDLSTLNTPGTADIVTAINSMLDSAESQSMFDSNLADSNIIANIANRSIANSKLINNIITINGIEFALGDNKALDTTDSGVQVGLIKATIRADSDTGIHYDSNASATIATFSLDKVPNSSLANSTFSVNGVSGALGTNITVDVIDSSGILNLVRDSALTITDAGGDGSLAYNSSTGELTYTGPSASEVRAHFTADSGISITDGAISVGTGLVKNAMLEGSIENAKLANSSITINGSPVSLGGSVAIGAIDSAKTQGMIDSNFSNMPASITFTQDSGSFTINAINDAQTADINLNVENYGVINFQENGGDVFSFAKDQVSGYGHLEMGTGLGFKLSSKDDIELTATGSGNIYLDPTGGKIWLDNSTNTRGYLGLDTANTIKLYTGTSTLNSTFSNDDLTVQGDVTSISDVRTKENIETIAEGLEIVDAMRGVYYNKIGEAERKVGVIAQEVETVLPEVIKTDEDGMKSVDYGKMVGVLIEAIKDLKHEIDDLKRGL